MSQPNRPTRDPAMIAMLVCWALLLAAAIAYVVS